MAVTRTSNPVLQFFDNDGKPLVGGYIVTYDQSTNVKVSTYKDSNGAMNPSTIMLDSNGKCVIYLNPSITYKFEIYRKDGSRVDEIKDVRVPNYEAEGSGSGYDNFNIAPEFSSRSTYATGDLVIYKGMLYRAKSPINVAGAWNYDDWTQVKMSEVVPTTIQSVDGGNADFTKRIVAREYTEGSVLVGFLKDGSSVNDNVALIALNAKSVKEENAGKVLAINSDGTDVELVEQKGSESASYVDGDTLVFTSGAVVSNDTLVL